MAVFTPKLVFFKSVKPLDGFLKNPCNLGVKNTVSKTDFLGNKWSGFDLRTLLEVFPVL
jgi:hypothetical protein